MQLWITLHSLLSLITSGQRTQCWCLPELNQTQCTMVSLYITNVYLRAIAKSYWQLAVQFLKGSSCWNPVNFGFKKSTKIATMVQVLRAFIYRSCFERRNRQMLKIFEQCWTSSCSRWLRWCQSCEVITELSRKISTNHHKSVKTSFRNGTTKGRQALSLPCCWNQPTKRSSKQIQFFPWLKLPIYKFTKLFKNTENSSKSISTLINW